MMKGPTAEAYSHGPCQVSTSAKPWLLNKVLPLRSGISQRRQRMTSIKAALLLNMLLPALLLNMLLQISS